MAIKKALDEGTGKEQEKNPRGGPLEKPFVERIEDAEGGGGLPLFDDETPKDGLNFDLVQNR